MITAILKQYRRWRTFRSIRANYQPLHNISPLHLQPVERVLYRSMSETNHTMKLNPTTREKDIIRLATRERKALKMLKNKRRRFYEDPTTLFFLFLAGLAVLMVLATAIGAGKATP